MKVLKTDDILDFLDSADDPCEKSQAFKNISNTNFRCWLLINEVDNQNLATFIYRQGDNTLNGFQGTPKEVEDAVNKLFEWEIIDKDVVEYVQERINNNVPIV